MITTMTNELAPIRKSTRLEYIREANNSAKESRTERMEDYLEVIYELVQQKGYANSADIAEYLNVRPPSVTKMLRRLADKGHINYERYRGISLTHQGVLVAKTIRQGHSLLSDFLKMIGVPDEIANRDAEGIEHHLHPATMAKLERFLQTTKSKVESN